MASRNATDQPSNPTKTVDASLWWESFSSLLTELENASLTPQLPLSLEKKLKDNHAWFLESLSLFKRPNQASRVALDSPIVKIGSHDLNIQPELKSLALKISSIVCLDEVQSYIVVKRSVEHHNVIVGDVHPEILNLVLLEYYIERQCLLKCVRQILIHALYYGSQSGVSAVLEEAQRMISDGLESKLLSILHDLLSSNYPDHMDIDLYTLWAEEMLIEDNLILDILFIAYYESFCTCDAKCWKKLCQLFEDIVTGSYNFQKLAISSEAVHAIYHAKVQLLLILIEALNLENLLQMIHDNIPFRQGSISFSETEIQEMDTVISSFNAIEVHEVGPLILAWAVFLCLVYSLPERDKTNFLMDIDHTAYVRQAFEASSLGYFLDILQSDTLKNSDGPLAGYCSVLRTFISAFIASYEISFQFEDNNMKLLLEILCKIYRGEESLCVQFWDRDSFIDGPVRCLLCNLEGEFPFKTTELLSLLSALCEGAWPSECVYNFLDKSVGLSTPLDISSDSDVVSKMVETTSPLRVAGIEGLVIPRGSRGQVLRMIDQNTALVRWQYSQSGVTVLLLRLAQAMNMKNSDEIIVILDLISRLVTFSRVVSYSLLDARNFLRDEVTTIRINLVELVCTLVKSLSPSVKGVVMMSMGVTILSKMLKCFPSHVARLAMKDNIFNFDLRTSSFDAGSDNLSRGTWLLSGRLAKMLLIDCEQSDCSMTLSVLDLTERLLQTGLEIDTSLALIVFSIQYVFVNHEYWKYKVKHARWKVTIKFAIKRQSTFFQKDKVVLKIHLVLAFLTLANVRRSFIVRLSLHLFYSAIVGGHQTFYIVHPQVLEVMKKCISSISSCEKLGMVVRDILLSDASVHSALFRIVCTTTQNLEKLYVSRIFEIMDIEGLQLAISSGLDVLISMLSALSKDSQSPSAFHQAILSPTTKPILVISAAVSLVSYFRDTKIQICAARLLSALFIADVSKSYTYSNLNLGLDDKQVANFRKSIGRILSEQSPWNEDLVVATWKYLTLAARYETAFLTSVIAPRDHLDGQSHIGDGDTPNKTESSSLNSEEDGVLDAILDYLKESDDLLNRKPNILLSLLSFLSALWQGAPQFTRILEQLKLSDKFWRPLTHSVMLVSSHGYNTSEKLNQKELENLPSMYQYLSNLFDILGYEMFLQNKLIRADHVVKRIHKSASSGTEREQGQGKNKDKSVVELGEIISGWSKSSLLTDLIKSCVSCEYDTSTHLRAKVVSSLFAVHIMVKLKTGELPSLSVSLIERGITLSRKLCKLPAFSELLTQYSVRGYSGGLDLSSLILSDLFYHIQGELEGREIDNRPFKELLQFLLDSEFLDIYKYKEEGDFAVKINGTCLFDLARLREDLGLDMWDMLGWKESKEIAEYMLQCLQDVNSMMLLSSSKLSALRGLIILLTMHDQNLTQDEALAGQKLFDEVDNSCIDHVCQCLHAMLESLTPLSDANEDIIDILIAEVELLVLFVRSRSNSLSQHSCLRVLKTSGHGLKVLGGCRPSIAVGTAKKLVLMLIVNSLQATGKYLHFGISGTESVEASPEPAYSILALIPILCNCIEQSDHCILSLTSIDLIAKCFSTTASWFPIVRKHLPLQHFVQKLQDPTSFKTVPVILKFLLNLARVRQGAEMLLNFGVLGTLRMLLSGLPEGGGPFSTIQSERSFLNGSDRTEKPQQIWGLTLAIITAIIQSSADDSARVVDSVMASVLVEKAPLVSYYLSAPDFPPDSHEKKRPHALKPNISFSELKETENTLVLICVLARYPNSWGRVLKDMDSLLREKSIHFLAFISRANPRPGESSRRDTPLLCHPVLKEEFEWHQKPSFVNSKSGWFALSAIGCKSNLKFSSLPFKTTALVSIEQSNGNGSSSPHTHFSDMVAMEIYRIAFVLLRFLCTQAEIAASKADEVGFVDLAHFPDLPMPDILHGLQDQGITIATELCEANKTKEMAPEIQDVCLLLLRITVMALYLEFCVIQICGIRPVLGYVETFSKELRLLIKATEGYVFLKMPLKNLKQIVSFVYPDLLQAENLF